MSKLVSVLLEREKVKEREGERKGEKEREADRKTEIEIEIARECGGRRVRAKGEIGEEARWRKEERIRKKV